MQAIVRARKVGGSLMVRIPPEIVQLEQLRPDDALQIEVEKARKDWFGAFKGCGSFTKEDELNTHE